MLCFSTTLFLSGTCLLLSAGVSSEIVTTCDSVHHLSSDVGAISVQATLYGRTDSATCSEGIPLDQVSQTNCSLVGAVDVVKKRCDGKRVCELSSSIFTAPDPCPDTLKYLQTKYTCLPAIHLVTCEHSLAHLQCDDTQVIFVYGANYGRHDQTTCSYERTNVQKTDCSSPASKIADSCNGKNSCTIKVDNSVFGDPCEGTYKYLEVAYTCQYPL